MIWDLSEWILTEISFFESKLRAINFATVMLCSLINHINWRKGLICRKSDEVNSCQLNERINETTKRTCFRALRDDITGGQSLRNLSKHRPQLTRLGALKQHLRDELKLSESEENHIPQCNWAKVKGNDHA